MVYLGLQDDDEYGYDGYGDARYDQTGGQPAAGYDDGYGGQGRAPDPYAEGYNDPRGGPDDGYGGRAYPEPRGVDVRPVGEARADSRTVAVREPPGAGGSVSTMGGPAPGGAGVPGAATGVGMGDSAVRPLPRDDQPSGVTVSRPAVVRAVPTTAGKVHVVEPRGFNDAQEVGDRVKANQAVILNLQSSDKELRRRLIDFSSGLAYAMGGSMSRVADAVFLITPLNVQLSEEEKDRLEARGLYRRD
jgi:cell division inhibitor SepF